MSKNIFVNLSEKESMKVVGGRTGMGSLQSGDFGYQIGCALANTKWFKKHVTHHSLCADLGY